MMPFPNPAELSFLVGAELNQVVLNPYSLNFCFINGGGITVEGCIEHIDKKGRTHLYDCQMRDAGALSLHQLLELSIVSISVEPLCLSLIFSTGETLRILSELGPYESGQIYSSKEDGGHYIVF